MPGQAVRAAEPEGGSEAPADAAFLADVVAGLTAARKTLPAKYFYDAHGSALFEAITRLPEYYPTRTELALLRENGAAMGALLPAGAGLVEFGSGSSAKARALLAHLRRPALHVPVDVSAEYLAAEAAALRRDLPCLRVMPLVADFAGPLTLPEEARGLPLVGFFPGSTIGNFEPPAAAGLLRHFGEVLGADAHLLVGVDLVKDKAVLDAAYDDAAGVTARFNLNLLDRINRELGADLDPDGFAHRAFYDPALRRVEMHLVSRRAQSARIGPVRVAFAEGETIHTENSYKYTPEGFRALGAEAGWTSLATWVDPAGLFSVHLLRRG